MSLGNNMVRLRDITTKIGSGATPRGGKEAYKNNGITLIRSLNVYDFKFDYQGLAYIDETQAQDLSNVEVKPGDILLNITGASVARCCIVPKHLLPARVNQHVAILRMNPIRANPHYILYVINSPQYKQQLLALAQGGATREALTKDTIGNFEVPLPSLSTQCKIASILSAYDDLIENNTRRITLLEDMAQSLYQEWFVHFRFPGHEKKRMVESQLGVIPEGWEVVKLGNVITLQRGFDLPASQREKGDFPVYAATGINGTHTQMKVKGPGVVTGRSGSIGTVLYVKEDFWPLNTTLWVKNFHRSTATHTFYLLRGIKLSSFNSGAAVPTLNRNDVHNVEVVLPPINLINEFDQLVAPIFEMKRTISKRNENLRRTRDLLLPQLISGEINVERLVIEVSEEASREALGVS